MNAKIQYYAPLEEQKRTSAKAIKTITFDEFVAEIKSDKHKALTEQIRAEGDKAKQNELKAKLPQFMSVETKDGGRKAEDFIAMHGLFLDIDLKHGAWSMKRDKIIENLKNFNRTDAVFRSPGKGVRAFFSLESPITNYDAAKAFSTYVRALVNKFCDIPFTATVYGRKVKILDDCSPVTPFYFSHDPEISIKPGAGGWNGERITKKWLELEQKRKELEKAEAERRVMEPVDAATRAKAYHDLGCCLYASRWTDYQDWLRLGMIAKLEGEEVVRMWDRLSEAKGGETYDKEGNRQKLESFDADKKKGSCTWGTLVYWAREDSKQMLSDGLIDQSEYDRRKALWSHTEKKENDKPVVRIPKQGTLASATVKDILKALPNDKYFRKDCFTLKVVKGKAELVDSSSWITELESFANPGVFVPDKESGYRFIQDSLSTNDAGIILASSEFRAALNEIDASYTYVFPMPMDNGGYRLLSNGYNKDYRLWIEADIKPEIMPLADAVKAIDGMLEEFCFVEPVDKSNAIAWLLTPLVRLYSEVRTPLFIAEANREGAGKDYLLGLAQVIYLGVRNVAMTVLNADGDDECRKKITSALKEAAFVFHISNFRGTLSIPSLEAALTSEVWVDRKLGSQEDIRLANPMLYCLSGNEARYTADINRRRQIIRLAYFEDVSDARSFKRDLYKWVLDNRKTILSALFSLFHHWHEAGKPFGKRTKSGYAKWAHCVDGIICHAGWASIFTEPQLKVGNMSDGDDELAQMRLLMPVWWTKHKVALISISDLCDLVKEAGAFTYLDLDSKKDRRTLGHKIKRYDGRLIGRHRIVRDADAGNHAKYRLEEVPEIDGGKNANVDDQNANVANASSALAHHSQPNFVSKNANPANVANVTLPLTCRGEDSDDVDGASHHTCISGSQKISDISDISGSEYKKRPLMSSAKAVANVQDSQSPYCVRNFATLEEYCQFIERNK